MEDGDMLGVSATLGALIYSTHSPLRIQDVKVRVGDYGFDNTNYLFSDAFRGARYDTDQLPIETNYAGLRHILWLATDRGFKTAEERVPPKKAGPQKGKLPSPLPRASKAGAGSAPRPHARL